jgi:formyl-CoA transferase
MWNTLFSVIGKPNLLEDPRFREMTERRRNLKALYREIAAWTLQHTKDEAMRLIAEAGVPASKVFDTQDLFNDPHLLERGFVHELQHPVHGKIKLLGWPARMSESHVDILVAPTLGQHTDEVMSEFLGLSPDRIRELRELGVLGNL